MATLKEIPGIGEASLKLLAAVGIGSATELAEQSADHLAAELKRANDHLSMVKRAPSKDTIAKWIAMAKKLVGAESSEPTPVAPPANHEPENFEANAELVGMLSLASCAIPLPAKIMMEKGLRVSDVPAGILIDRHSGDLDVRSGDPAVPQTDLPKTVLAQTILPKTILPQTDLPRTVLPKNDLSKNDAPLVRSFGQVESISKQVNRRHFDASTAKAMTSVPSGGKRVPVSKSGHEEDRVALIRAPREETNRGKDPESRRYVRGVLHTHPWSLRLGSFFTLLLLIHLPFAVVSAFLLLASREKPEVFAWVPEWLLAFPIALPLTGLGYLFWGVSGRCRICNQKLFVGKGALKHPKAHRIPGMGFVLPLCLHLLAFSWFRCSSCGTPVRLKK